MMDYQLPFPIILADVYSVNTNYTPLAGADVPIQNVVYEFTPYEFGSYDPALSAFIATNIVRDQLSEPFILQLIELPSQ